MRGRLLEGGGGEAETEEEAEEEEKSIVYASREQRGIIWLNLSFLFRRRGHRASGERM